MPVDPTKLARARALKAQGMSLRAIGKDVGVSHVALRKWPLDETSDARAPELVKEVAEHVSARRQRRTPADGRDWLGKLWGFLERLDELAGDPNADKFERRMAASAGAEYSLAAFELTADLEETEAGATR